MPSIDGPRLVQRPRILSAEIDGEVVLYDGDTGRAHLLSKTGSLLWPAFSSPVTARELGEDVADVFELTVEEAIEQVAAFCDQLIQMGVVEAVDQEHETP